MFIAMNRFPGEAGLRAGVRDRVGAPVESYLGSMAGFVEFHLLEGPGRRRSHAVFVAHHLGRQGGVRGLDQVGGVPPRSTPAPTTRPARASISAIPSSRVSR